MFVVVAGVVGKAVVVVILVWQRKPAHSGMQVHKGKPKLSMQMPSFKQ
jgi:hypothetical protein